MLRSDDVSRPPPPVPPPSVSLPPLPLSEPLCLPELVPAALELLPDARPRVAGGEGAAASGDGLTSPAPMEGWAEVFERFVLLLLEAMAMGSTELTLLALAASVAENDALYLPLGLSIGTPAIPGLPAAFMTAKSPVRVRFDEFVVDTMDGAPVADTFRRISAALCTLPRVNMGLVKTRHSPRFCAVV